MIGSLGLCRVFFALVAAGLLFGCGDSEPTRTSLSALTAAQLDFNGRSVRVSGTLRTFDAPRHYWIENENLDRVALIGPDELAPLVGQTIEVSGLFVYDPNAGRRIEVEQISTAPEEPTDWNAPLPQPDAKATYFAWTPEEQLIGYRNMEKIFPARRVAADRASQPLPTTGEPLEVVYEQDGETWTTDRFMESSNAVGVLVLHRGQIVLERYRQGYDATQRWVSFSVAKSVTSTLVGAAIRDGAITSLDDPVTRYLPELIGSAYDGVTIHQLLTMTTGVAWNEDYEDPDSDVARIKVEPSVDGKDPIVAYMSRVTRETEPGARHQYNTGETHLTGSLVRAATGKHLADYLSEKIWMPLGMELDAYWLLTTGEAEQAGCCLSASLRDFARFGQFFMNGGTIGGTSVLPEGWVEMATAATEQSRVIEEEGSESGYGFMWWILGGGTYNAAGIFGQQIYLNPGLDLVVVIQSAWPTALWGFENHLNYPRAVEQAVSR